MRGRFVSALLALLVATAARPQVRGGGVHMAAPHSAGLISRGAVFAGSPRFGTRFHSGFRSQFLNPRFHHRSFSPFGGAWRFYAYPAYYYADYSYAPDRYGAYDRSLAYEQSRELAAEIDRLRDEIQRLREDQQARYAPPPPVTPAPRAEEKTEPTEPTILVFQDKHTQKVHNYAIVGQTLWIFTEQRARKVPMSSLDIEATRKTNEDHGVEFRVPQ
jgi:hypothetical protein